MPTEDQARSERNDHYRNVVSLAGAVRATVEGNRYHQHQEACTQSGARLDHTHLSTSRTFAPNRLSHSIIDAPFGLYPAASSRPGEFSRPVHRRLVPADDHVNLAAPAPRARQPLAPIEDGGRAPRRRARPPGSGLDTLPARLQRQDEPNLAPGPAARHR